MKEAAEEQVETRAILPSLYAPIQEDLAQVDKVFREELHSEFPFVHDLVQYGFRLGGKRLRPALVLLSGRACGRVRREHYVLAAAVEMIHTATLVHDDVLDEAILRRHLDTVNARWNNETSVLLGDYLFTQALCLSSALGDVFACQMIGDASRRMCEGELRQIESRGNYDLTEDQYFDIVSGKTAALTSCCCRLGAHYAGADSNTIEAMSRYGLQLGIAFQIADDVLDLLGDEATVGKSLGTDLVKQKSTLPLIRLLNQATPVRRSEIVAQLSGSANHDRDFLRSDWESSDAISYARDVALQFSLRANRELLALDPSTARDSLADLAEFVVTRQY